MALLEEVMIQEFQYVEFLGGEPPEKMVYEWIQLKGSGPMSSSSGNTIGPIEALI